MDLLKETNIQKVGNGHFIPLPKHWLDLKGLSKGSPVEIYTDGDDLLIKITKKENGDE